MLPESGMPGMPGAPAADSAAKPETPAPAPAPAAPKAEPEFDVLKTQLAEMQAQLNKLTRGDG